MSTRFTVLGAAGFIGRNLVRHLRAAGHSVDAVSRDRLSSLGGDLGHVISAIGLTADFRTRPFETVAAHVDAISDVLQRASFASLLYLSSTRVYAGGHQTAEQAALTVSPENLDHLYNISKLMGESLCLSRDNRAIRVARLSNVVGSDDFSDNFLASVVAEARSGNVVFRTAPDSERDFIAITDVCGLLEAIALKGTGRLYNVASGRNVRNDEIAALIAQHGIETQFARDAVRVTYPPIETGLIQSEFDFRATSFSSMFAGVMAWKSSSTPA